MIYLDNNASTRPAPEVVEVIARCLRDVPANPGSRHAPGRQARRVLEDSRESLAALLGARPEEVIFTSGGTEANNMAVLGFSAGTSGTIALTAGEHPAVLEAARSRTAVGWRLQFLPVDDDGLLEGNQAAALAPDVHLVSIILAHNETGVIQDLSELSAHCTSRMIPLHVDAVQAVGKIPVNFRDLGAASLALGAHKFNGPRGVGALLLRKGWKLAPTEFGGHQESGRRPGTEPVALIAGMARALELFHAEAEARTARIIRLRDHLQQGLCERCPPTVINGSLKQRLPNTLNIAFPGLDGEALLVALDLEGICCSLGSTCASGSTEPAPALIAMGRPPEVALASVRFSLGIDTTEAEIDQALTIVPRVVERLRAQTEAG